MLNEMQSNMPAAIQVNVPLSVCNDRSSLLPAFIIRSGSQGTLNTHHVLVDGYADKIDSRKIGFSVIDCDGQDMGAYILDVLELSASIRDDLFIVDVKKPA